jgi:hypothetical protein
MVKFLCNLDVVWWSYVIILFAWMDLVRIFIIFSIDPVRVKLGECCFYVRKMLEKI